MVIKKMFEPSYNWHFTKNEPYKHYFKSFYKQFKRLSASDPDSLLDNVISECNKAINEFNFLRDSGIVFPNNGGGEHLSTWITVINLWKRDITR
ncbi:hypothetical protein [Desulforegula conservatrix]|uniref:hypothetical protein n=1 Tax=Desulforegula conservatrix TaxID=153026 RepID=UPI000401E3A9|nr:hypothetical protein [Desulforegula conservatrix]